MKKISLIVLISISICVQCSYGQITTSKVKVENTNNVTSINGNLGIGTDLPGIWFNDFAVELKNLRPVLHLNSTGSINTIAFRTTAMTNSLSNGEFHLNHEYNSSNPEKSGLYFFSYDLTNEVSENLNLALIADGHVGIGVENPQYKLEVDGTVRATTFSAIAPPSWPDFVFNKDYRLRTLEEVEEHIHIKGHLPEIPSESEVTENGINLGEMNAKLLQKIEELTLYMIDMNKRMNQLEQENSQLKEKVNRLENN